MCGSGVELVVASHRKGKSKRGQNETLQPVYGAVCTVYFSNVDFDYE